MNMDDIISHLQIMHTWAKFALEKDQNFFNDSHMKSIAKWTVETIAVLKGQENEIENLKTLLWGYESGAIKKR